jgi:hypothetical protein
MRLATVERLCIHLNYLHRVYPGETFAAIKMDGEKAFRQLAQAECERGFLAHRCAGQMFYNATLVMGAQANPDNMADSMLPMADWSAFWLGVLVLCYVDDWLSIFRQRLEAPVARSTRSLWDWSGWRWRLDKGAGIPESVITFLGVWVDLNQRLLGVTPERCEKLVRLLSAWLRGEVPYTPTQFASLAGKLRFIAPVVPFGKAFTSSFFRFTRWAPRVEQLEPGAALPADVRLDLQWWLEVLSARPPVVSFAEEVAPATCQVEIWSDSSGHMYGAYCPAAQEYIQGPWSLREEACSSITHREWATVVFAFVCWGHLADGAFVRMWCDNMASVIGGEGSSFADLRLRMMLRFLCVCQMHSGATVELQHIPGVSNVFADALSRGYQQPPQFSRYSRREVPPMTRQLISEMLSRWLGDLDMAADRVTHLFKRFWNTVTTEVTASRRPFRLISLKRKASRVTVHTGVC